MMCRSVPSLEKFLVPVHYDLYLSRRSSSPRSVAGRRSNSRRTQEAPAGSYDEVVSQFSCCSLVPALKSLNVDIGDAIALQRHRRHFAIHCCPMAMSLHGLVHCHSARRTGVKAAFLYSQAAISLINGGSAWRCSGSRTQANEWPDLRFFQTGLRSANCGFRPFTCR